MDSKELRSESSAPSISEIPERLVFSSHRHKNARGRGQLDSDWNDRGGIYDSSPPLLISQNHWAQSGHTK